MLISSDSCANPKVYQKIIDTFLINIFFYQGVKELPNEQKGEEQKDKEHNKSEGEGSPTKSVFSNSPSIASISSLSKRV